MTQTFPALVGYTSTALIAVTLVPQAIRLVRTREVAGLSPTTYVLYSLGNLSGWWYGALIGSGPVVLSSAIAGVFSVGILAALGWHHYAARRASVTVLDASEP